MAEISVCYVTVVITDYYVSFNISATNYYRLTKIAKTLLFQADFRRGNHVAGLSATFYRGGNPRRSATASQSLIVDLSIQSLIDDRPQRDFRIWKTLSIMVSMLWFFPHHYDGVYKLLFAFLLLMVPSWVNICSFNFFYLDKTVMIFRSTWDLTHEAEIRINSLRKVPCTGSPARRPLIQRVIVQKPTRFFSQKSS